jgi:uncharacterized protein with HEPN domain
MPPEEKDPAFLWDMREASRKLADLVLQTSEVEFPAAETVRFAVERLVLVLGEAAARVSEPYPLTRAGGSLLPESLTTSSTKRTCKL